MVRKLTKTLHAISNPRPHAVLFLLLLFSLLLISKTSSSQNVKVKGNIKHQHDTMKLELGISSGLTVNNFSDEQPHTGINLGYTGGLSFRYIFYKGFSLQVETNYIQKGGQLIRFKDDTRYGAPESFNSKNVKNSSFTLHSVDIPLLLNYTFKINQTWKPSIYAGGSFTYVAGATERYEKTGDLLPSEDIIATVTGYQNVVGEFEKTHYNSLIGSSIQVPFLKRSFILLDFRYVAGLTAAKKDFSYMEKAGFGVDVRANSFIMKAGIIFPLK